MALGTSWIPAAVTAACVLLLLTAEIFFLRQPTKKSSKLVELVGAVYALAALIGSAVGFIAA